MAPARKPPLPRRRPTAPETAPDAPDTAEDADQVEEAQVVEDVAVEDDMGHPAEPGEYPPVDKNGEPDGYIITGDDKVKESWFEKSKDNDELVVPRKAILKRVYPPNTLTPSYVQLAVEGVPMTKAAAVRLGTY